MYKTTGTQIAYIRLHNEWVVTDPTDGDKELYKGKYLINSRYGRNETIQILNHDNSSKCPNSFFVGKSMALASTIAKFLNKDIQKSFDSLAI